MHLVGLDGPFSGLRQDRPFRSSDVPSEPGCKLQIMGIPTKLCNPKAQYESH
jgi:hypothetical protein